MNNKLLSYEETLKQLKELELQQIFAKVHKRGFRVLGKDEAMAAKKVHENKKEINKLLTIIHLHKQTRKMHYLLKHYEECAEG